MPPTTLRFVETVQAPYPVPTNGAGTATTVCLHSGDPYLAFITQVPGGDQIRYLHMPDLSLGPTAPLPANRLNCTGLGFDPVSRKLIMCFPANTVAPDNSRNEIVAVDPVTGVETAVLAAPAPTSPLQPTQASFQPQGIATNGVLIARASDFAGIESKIELFSRRGVPLGTASFPGRRIRGITSSPWSWAYVDMAAHEIVVVGPFGTELATAAGVGGLGDPTSPYDPAGMASIAFDMVGRDGMEHEPQEWLPGGNLGAPGTINHPDTPWTPEPWGGRHRLFIANETDQTIYGGYLTAD